MTFRIIKSPSQSTLEILKTRVSWKIDDEIIDKTGAIGLVQGKMIDMIFVSDIAEKSADVIVRDVRGNCPQHMVLLAIFGDISSVEAAMEEIKKSMSIKIGEI